MSKKAKDVGENMVKKLPEEQEFFMRIANPNLFRRSLLETSKDVLIILKRTYNVQQIREAKQDTMGRVSQEIGEIKTLIKKLYEMIPQYSREELKKVMPEGLKKRPEPAKAEPKPTDKSKSQLQPQQQAKPAMSDYDKLTKALDDITKKLQTL